MKRDDLFLLGKVKLAAPCSQSWSQMRGDDRVRYCGLCKQNVYDVSELDAVEARALLNRSEGRLCVRLWQRADGRILTRECTPGVALRAQRRVVSAIIAATAAFLAVVGISRLPFWAPIALAGDCDKVHPRNDEQKRAAGFHHNMGDFVPPSGANYY